MHHCDDAWDRAASSCLTGGLDVARGRSHRETTPALTRAANISHRNGQMNARECIAQLAADAFSGL